MGAKKKIAIPHTNMYAKIMNGHKSYKTTKKVFNDLTVEGLHIISCKELMGLINNNDICYYENNRGYAGIIDRHVERLVDEFDWDSLGMITVVYDRAGKRFITVDASHRLSMLCEKAVSGDLEPYWHEELAVKVLNRKQFFTVYQNINSGVSHKMGNILTNEDLAYGSLIAQVISLAESTSGIENTMKNKHYKTLAFLIYGLYAHKDIKGSYMRDWSYENVWYQNSRLAGIDMGKPVPIVSDCQIFDIGELADGVAVVFAYMERLAKARKQFEKGLKDTMPDQHTRRRALHDAFPAVLTSNSLLGYLMCAGSREVFRMPADADLWFDEIFKRGTRLSKIFEQSGNASRVDFSRFLDKAIFGNTKVGKNALRYWPR